MNLYQISGLYTASANPLRLAGQIFHVYAKTRRWSTVVRRDLYELEHNLDAKETKTLNRINK